MDIRRNVEEIILKEKGYDYVRKLLENHQFITLETDAWKSLRIVDNFSNFPRIKTTYIFFSDIPTVKKEIIDISENMIKVWISDASEYDLIPKLFEKRSLK